MRLKLTCSFVGTRKALLDAGWTAHSMSLGLRRGHRVAGRSQAWLSLESMWFHGQIEVRQVAESMHVMISWHAQEQEVAGGSIQHASAWQRPAAVCDDAAAAGASAGQLMLC